MTFKVNTEISVISPLRRIFSRTKTSELMSRDRLTEYISSIEGKKISERRPGYLKYTIINERKRTLTIVEVR